MSTQTLRRATAAFGRNDLKSVRRDAIMPFIAIGPFGYAALMWLIPPFTDFLQRQYDFDLTPYHMLLVSGFVVGGPIAVLGALGGLMLLDDKDQHTLSALRVAPIPRQIYPLYRAAMITVITTISVTLALPLTRLVPAELVLRSIPVAFVCGLTAAWVSLLMPAIASNKVEGLAVMRAIGMLLLGLPFIPWFMDSQLQLLFGVLPTYWPVKAFWLASEGATYWPYIAGGIAYISLLLVLLLRRLGRVS